ncbi:SusC/RagA family TonB-linked outer membrane protein [Longitalea luteola]|uniref:SusC/RagA family TonB-linked outer membrane protein n=1 Tax=Longitalea luteola TaxID=2812563 RepID=UPI001A956AFE|nr:TonB-dependent receptor [Longitalea luteola]
MKKRLLLYACLLFAIVPCFAQTSTVKGKVTGSNNEPLSGAGVSIKGQNTGVVTNGSGEFTLAVADDAVLVISHIGYLSREIPVAGKTFIEVSLQSQEAQMNEVVVIGYQSVSRKSVTTAVSSLSSKEIKSYVTGNVANAIQGKMAGVQVFSGNGLPGSQPTILIRGLSSLSKNTTPLVIVDGNEMGYNALNFLNPADIESIDVLKDASASAIYGSRAGQGVILVTTKRGKGKPSVSFEASYGWDKVPKVKLADASEYVRIMNTVAANSGAAPYFPNPDNVTHTDYWNSTFDVGNRQNYNLSVTGGKDGLSIYGNLGYYKQNSYYATDKGGDWSRITARLNIDFALNKIFKVGLQFAPRFEKWLNSDGSNLSRAYMMDPTTLPFKSADSVLRSIPNGFMDMTAFNPYYSMPNRSPVNGVVNPDFYFRTNFNNNDAWGAQYSLYAEAKPVKNLTLRTQLEGFGTATSNTNYTPKYYLATNSNNREDQVYQDNQQNMRWKITNTANYRLTLNKHNIDLLAGQSADDFTVKGTSVTKKGIPFEEEPYQYVSAAPTVVGASGWYQPGASTGSTPFGKMVSYFGSFRYNFNERYYLTATMRADGTSLVNPLYRWGYFPTLSAAWVISDEPFFEKLNKTVNYLKLRASWGKAGGNLPGLGLYYSTVGPISYPDANGAAIIGYTTNYIANPEIKWEEQEDYTVGLDGNLFQNKLNFTLEGYIRTPRNLLLSLPVDPVLGYAQGYIPTQEANVGKLTTKGWDINIGYRDNITKQLRFGVDLILSHFKSVADNLGANDPIRYGVNNDVITTFRSRVTKGHEPGAWYGYEVLGVFQTDAEAAAYVNKDNVRMQPLAKAGDLIFKDIDGDGVIDNKDLTDLGSPWPKLTGGLTLTLNYSNFDFRAEFYGSYGQKYNNGYRLLMNGSGKYNFMSGLGDKFWHGEGTSNSFPILKATDPNGNFSKMNSFLVEDASFTRCRLIQLGYTLPRDLVKAFNSLRIYASAQNLFTLTNYSGLNPELPFQGIGLNGIDNFQPTQARTYLLGLSVGL